MVDADVAADNFRKVYDSAQEKAVAMKDLQDASFAEYASQERSERTYAQALAARPTGADAKSLLFDYVWDESKVFPFR